MENLNCFSCVFVLKGSALNRGMNTGLENLAWGLAEQGIACYILSGGDAPVSHDFTLPENVHYFFTGKSVYNPCALIPLFRKIIETHKIDAVIGWVAYISPVAMAVNDGHLKFIAHEGQMPPRSLFLRFVKRALLRQMTIYETINTLQSIYKFPPKCDKLISISKAVQVATIEAHGFKPEICSVIPRGVDTQIFRPLKLQKKSTGFNLLYAGNVHEPKGINDLIAALAMIFVPVTLTLCGKGDMAYINRLKKAVYDTRLGHELVYAGSKRPSELVEYYQNADVFVFPSHQEGLGKALLEAMSCGCPVVCSELPVFKEFIINNVNGLMVPVKSPIKLAEAILKYLKNPNLRKYCADNAVKTIESSFSKTREIDSWMKLLSGI